MQGSKPLEESSRLIPRRSGGDVVACGRETGTTIFYGGPILTITDAQPEVEAIAIRDGSIIAVGDRRSVFEFHCQGTTMIDLRGRALMPGFIDSHVHLAWSAFTKHRWVNVAPPIIKSRAELIAALRAAAARKKPGEWVIACGHNPAWQSSEDGLLTISELDKASTRNPIFVLSESGDAAYLNHKALEAAESEVQTIGSQGLLYVRAGDGNPTGELRGASSFGPLFRAFPEATFEENLADCQQVLREWAGRGCTTIYDAGLGGLWGLEEVRLFLELASDPVTPMRLRAALVPFGDLPLVAGVKPKSGNERLSFLGIKFRVDGFAPSITGIMSEPMPVDPKDCRLNYSDDDLLWHMREWHNAGWQLLVYADSNKAIEQALTVFDALLSESPRANHRHRIEHCTSPEDSHLAYARRLGLSITHNIGRIYYSGAELRDRVLGEDAARRIAPLASDFGFDLPVSLQSDSPATPVEPLQNVQTAVTRTIGGGQEVLGPEQRITVDQALKTVTLYPAYQCFLDDRVGSLEVGKLADLVLLDRNPRAVDPFEIGKIAVLETYIGGVMQSSA